MTTKPQWMHGTTFELKSWAASYTQLLMQCRGDDRPDALIIGDDHFVPEVTQVIRESGVEVPKEFEVVAFAVFPTPTPSAVPATRLGFNASQLFGTCMNYIERGSRGQEIPDETLIEPLFEHEL